MRYPPISRVLLLRILLCGINILFVSSQCLDHQRSLLLQLKSTLIFDSSNSTKLVKWNQSSECCNWLGVACDVAGHVTTLDLSSELITGGINDYSALFSLSFLQSLNLANNSFGAAQIPRSFGNLTNLNHLNLSDSGFAGQIPIELSQLNKLVSLDLSTLYFPEAPSFQLQNPNLSILLQNFTRTAELYLDGVNISAKGSYWGEAISSSLPNLQVLSMSKCYLSGPIDSSLLRLRFLSEIHLDANNFSTPVPEYFANFSNLTVLSLYSCNLFGTFPIKIFQLPILRILHLENNQFLHGSLPKFPQNGLLQSLVLSGTNFSGRLPHSIGNLKSLSHLALSECKFTGPLPNSMANLSQLVHLEIDFNMFTGRIPSFQKSKNLAYLDLSHNTLTGPVPSTHFEGLSKLIFIDLAWNLLNGGIPSSLFSLPSLQKILLSNNKFDGEIAEPKNKSLSPLDTLDISSNKLGGDIPAFIFELRRLSILSLAFNNFSGTIELEIVRHLERLSDLDLSYNSLSIDVDEGNSSSSTFPQLGQLRLASCKLQRFPALMDQSILFLLDLSNNQISGEIPSSLGHLTQLESLDLSHNKLSGRIPIQLRSLTFLSFLNLSYNQLVGRIPRGPQFQTFSEASFEGNMGLCGNPLNSSCNNASLAPLPTLGYKGSNSNIDDVCVSVAVGLVVGLGGFIGPLVLCKRWRKWYYENLDRVLVRIFHIKEKRERIRQKRAYRDRIRRL